MLIIATDAAGTWEGVLQAFSIDAAWGDDENDFEITVPEDCEIDPGAYVFSPWTEVGGIIDRMEYDASGQVTVRKYGGRTWHGILAGSIVKPPAGQSHLTLSGDINAATAQLIARQGLVATFEAAPGQHGTAVNFRVPRYVSVWEAIRRMAKEHGLRPSVEKAMGKAVISYDEVQESGGDPVTGDGEPYKATIRWRTTNHLVCLGKGELQDRLVVDVYADDNGRVGTTQTLFGKDEVSDTYEENSIEDRAELLAKGLEKLGELQERNSIDLKATEGSERHVGDIVRTLSAKTGVQASAEVVKVIFKANGSGERSVSYEVGSPTITASR